MGLQSDRDVSPHLGTEPTAPERHSKRSQRFSAKFPNEHLQQELRLLEFLHIQIILLLFTPNPHKSFNHVDMI